MVYTHTGDDTDFLSFFLSCISDTFVWHCSGTVHSDNTVFRFFTDSKSCTASARIGNTVGLGVRGSKTNMRELGKNQRYRTVFLLEFSTVYFGQIDLIESHSVTDEVKDIFCFLAKSRKYINKSKEKKE
ncbi:hypothetical protein D3C81_1445320 [compost metagenome]